MKSKTKPYRLFCKLGEKNSITVKGKLGIRIDNITLSLSHTLISTKLKEILEKRFSSVKEAEEWVNNAKFNGELSSSELDKIIITKDIRSIKSDRKKIPINIINWP